MTVYVDVLIILNLYINYLLILTASLMLRRSISRKRCLLSAFLGAVGSLIILAPTLAVYITIPYKILLGAGMVLTAFGKQRIRDFLVCFLFFLVSGFIFGGMVTAVWMFLSPPGIIINNGAFYFNIPIAALGFFTAGAYFLVKLVKILSDKRRRKFCTVKISNNNSLVSLHGLCDTGCEVRDVFSGTPVIVCDYEKASAVVPDEIVRYFAGELNALEKIRLIPCRTISDNAAIPAFRAQSVMIDGKNTDALVGVSRSGLGDDVDCVFNPKIIPVA